MSLEKSGQNTEEDQPISDPMAEELESDDPMPEASEPESTVEVFEKAFGRILDRGDVETALKVIRVLSCGIKK